MGPISKWILFVKALLGLSGYTKTKQSLSSRRDSTKVIAPIQSVQKMTCLFSSWWKDLVCNPSPRFVRKTQSRFQLILAVCRVCSNLIQSNGSTRIWLIRLKKQFWLMIKTIITSPKITIGSWKSIVISVESVKSKILFVNGMIGDIFKVQQVRSI